MKFAVRLFAAFLLMGFAPACFAQSLHRYDIVIDEVFPDPSPSAGLPNSEFLELKNLSSSPINLYGWKIGNGSNTASIKTDFILEPGGFVVICTMQASSAYSAFGQAIGVSGFPSLGNEGDTIYLQSPEGITVHALAYNKTWYQNDIKSEGGWTLEMIDTHNPCTGYGNWKASTSSRGGTPGMQNAVDGSNPDQQPPALLRTYTPDSLTIIAVFDEPLDSSSASGASDYILDKIGIPVSAVPVAPLFNEVRLKLATPLNANSIYQLSVSNVRDCAGNAIGAVNTARSGLPALADTNDIVINEILFNPRSGGYDYIELYNRSNKVIDLKQMLIAGRNITGDLRSIQSLSGIPYLFFPGEYMVITENSLWVEQNYQVNNPDKMFELPQLPSLPDDKGDIVLLNQEGRIIDELQYDHKWHFALVDNEEGIALERIDYNKPTQDPANWSSAASTAGFGTPAYQNSQFRADMQAKGSISLEPKTFSPDNDGFDDYCFIHYQVTEPGYVANITVFDANGRPVRYLAKNAMLGLAGDFRWDGLDENQRRLPSGIYVVLTAIFNLQGNTRQWKHAVVLARRFD